MVRLSTIRRGLILLILLTALAAVLVKEAPRSSAQANGQTPVFALQHDFGVWKYAVSQDDTHSAQVSIAYQHTTVEGLRTFVKANQSLAQQLKAAGNQRFEALVTFKRPLNIDQFTQFVAKNGLIVTAYTLRMKTQNGERWTITGGPENGVLVPHNRLTSGEDFVLQHAPDAVLAGVVDVQVTFDAGQYDTLQKWNDVFLVDVTSNLAKQETKSALPNVTEGKITVNGPHPYWFMEDLGLQNFQ